MTHEVAIIVGFVLMLMSLSLTTSQYAGLSFQLTRALDDKFKNPTATQCNWQPENKKFCTDTNSRCDNNCCQCTCDYEKSTFNRSTITCRKNDEIRSGCKAKFKDSYAGHRIKLLDLTKKDDSKIYWPTEMSGDKVKSFHIISIASHHDGSIVKTKFLKEKDKGKVKDDHGNWGATFQWDKVPNTYNGQMFRLNISYTIERKVEKKTNKLNRNDCLVFKSLGSIKVTFPSLPSTTLSTSTTKKSSSTITSVASSSTTTPPTRKPPNTRATRKTRPTPPTRKPTEPVKPVSTSEISTPTVSSSTRVKESKETRKRTSPTHETVAPPDYKPTPGARKEGSGGGDNTVTVSLVVVGCLVLLVAVVLVVLWKRRQSAKASKEKNGETVIANKSTDNPMMMSPMESIYAEADSSVNYPGEKGKNNVYDYAEGNLENNYTSLDMSKVEAKPTYQSLTNIQSNLYEQLTVTGNTKSSGVSGQTPIAEPFYQVVDRPDGTQDPGEIYHVLDDDPEENGNYKTREVPGRTGHENPERVYSTLEEEIVPENYNREVPGRTGDDNPERVYSVLEDENPESDYLTILPEKSEYEQPVNPPVSDA